jgi:hypothetical protein
MPRPRLQRATTARQEKIQLLIAEQIFFTPESLIHEFMNLTRLKIDCIRYDGAAEFAKSLHLRRSVSTIVSRWRKLQYALILSSLAPKVRYEL